jgi:hypothetical protein
MVRACFTGVLLLRLEIAELHASGGALIAHLPHARLSARGDGSPTPGLVCTSKSDTLCAPLVGSHGNVRSIIDHRPARSHQATVQEYTARDSSAAAIRRDPWDGQRVVQAVHGCTRWFNLTSREAGLRGG